MILKIKLANINTRIDTADRQLIKNTEDFRYDFRCEPDVSLKVTDQEIKEYCRNYRFTAAGEAENAIFAGKFFEQLPEFRGFALKGTAVAVKDAALLIVGEEDLRRRCLENLHFIAGGTEMLDDAYGIVRCEKDGWYLYGTPWRRKTGSAGGKKLSYIVLPGESAGVAPVDRQEALFAALVYTSPQKHGETLGRIVALSEKLLRENMIISAPADGATELINYIRKNSADAQTRADPAEA